MSKSIKDCECEPKQGKIVVSTDLFVPPRSLDFAKIASADMNAASRIIIVYSVAILSVFTAGIFWAQRYDRVDKTKLMIHDIRRKGAKAQEYFSNHNLKMSTNLLSSENCPY